MPDIDMTEQEKEIARLEAELKGETAEEVSEVETEELEQEEVKEEDEAAVNEEAEEVTEEASDEEKEPAKDDHSAWARLRRERAEEKRKAEKLAQELAELRAREAALQTIAQTKEKEPEKKIPDPETDPEGYLAYKLNENDKTIAELKRQIEERNRREAEAEMINRATQNFGAIISEYTSKNKDAEPALQFFEAELKKSIKLQNPLMRQQDIQKAANERILIMANQLVGAGLNPAEEFYAMAHEFGYKKQVEQTSKDEAPAKPKASLTNIDATKKRSATGLSAGGSGGQALMGIDALNGMSITDFAKLTPQQLRELESQA